MFATTVAAIASPPGMGAVSLIRVSGPDARARVGSAFAGKKAEQWQPRFQHFGRIVDAQGETVDEVLLTWFPAPHSFTGEEVVEVACHGGILITRLVLQALLDQGIELAAPGEFSQRAFFHGKLDLTQAEAIMDLIAAQTELAAQAAKEQLQGRLGAKVEEIRQDLIRLLAHLEAYVDFPDEDIDPDSQDVLSSKARELIREVDALLATADQGRLLREGIRTVIIGAPNAGKSSLLNLLLGYDRAIVSDQAGTTRDTLEEVLNLGGIPVRLVDTAGIRATDGSIEQEGIERSRREMDKAEWIWWIVDASAPKAQAEAVTIPEGKRVIRLLNKSDLPRHPDWEGAEGLSLSALEEDSREKLVAYFLEQIQQNTSWQSTHPLAINARHQQCLRAAKEQILAACDNLTQGLSPEFVSMDLRAALDHIGDITGKTDVEEILSEIFSTFCIGK